MKLSYKIPNGWRLLSKDEREHWIETDRIPHGDRWLEMEKATIFMFCPLTTPIIRRSRRARK